MRPGSGLCADHMAALSPQALEQNVGRTTRSNKLQPQPQPLCRSPAWPQQAVKPRSDQIRYSACMRANTHPCPSPNQACASHLHRPKQRKHAGPELAAMSRHLLALLALSLPRTLCCAVSVSPTLGLHFGHNDLRLWLCDVLLQGWDSNSDSNFNQLIFKLDRRVSGSAATSSCRCDHDNWHDNDQVAWYV